MKAGDRKQMPITSRVRGICIAAFLGAFLIFAWFVLPPRIHAADILKLTILHMNDPHARYVPYKEKDAPDLIGGFGKAARLIKQITEENREEGRETLVLMAGDLLTGTPFSMVWKGEVGVKLMNKMGFTAMVVGNHEFDYGMDNLLFRLLPMMDFPLLSANIVSEEGEPLFDQVLVTKYPRSGANVVIFGLTTEQTPVTTHPKNVKGVRFLDPTKTARQLVSGISKEDLVIALTHLGVTEDKKLARACPKIAVIVGGHSHTALLEPVKVRDTIIVQAGAYAKYLGRLDLEAEDGRVVKYSGRLILLTQEIAEDPELFGIIDEYKAKMDARFKEVIGKTDVFLEGGRSAVRGGKTTNLGKLITFTMAQSAGTQAALMNGGAIRSSLNRGNITLGDVYTVLPFSDRLVKMDLKGKDLLSVLQRSADLEEGSGGKLQSYGIDYATEKGRVKIRKVGKAPFDLNKTYTLATNDFLAAGGDGYDLLKDKGKNSYQDATQVTDLLVDFIKEKEEITAAVIEAI